MFRGARDKGIIASMERLGISQDVTIKIFLWRKTTLDWSLESHYAMGLAGGVCHDIGCRKYITCLDAISYISRRDGDPLNTTEWYTGHLLNLDTRTKFDLPS